MQDEIEQLVSRNPACITPITHRNSGLRSCRPSSGTSTRFCAGRNPAAERSRAMSDNLPRMDYRQHRRRGGWCMSAVTTTRGTACCWTTGSLAYASRAFPFPSCAAGSVWLSCPLTGSWPRPLVPGSRKRCAVCGAAFVPNPTGENTAPRRTHEENQSRRAKAETKAEMSRFRAFQTRINQGFFVGVKGYAIHLSFSPETAF